MYSNHLECPQLMMHKSEVRNYAFLLTLDFTCSVTSHYLLKMTNYVTGETGSEYSFLLTHGPALKLLLTYQFYVTLQLHCVSK